MKILATVVFPAPLMTTIAEPGSFLARESAAATPAVVTDPVPPRVPLSSSNGTATR